MAAVNESGAGAGAGSTTTTTTTTAGEASDVNQKYKRFVGFVADAVRFRRNILSVNAEKSNGHIPFGIKLSYALPQFSLTSLTMLIGIHGTLFYTQIGANVALIAFFTALARSFDVITDPVMGYMSDKTRTKYGRRRPYMVLGSWGYALMFILLFSPPLFESGESIALWFGFFYVLFYLFDTVGNVPYSALGPELSDVSTERDNLFFWTKLINGIGILFGAVGPVALKLMARGGNEVCNECSVITCPYGPGAAFTNGAEWNSAWGAFPDAWYNSTTCDTATFPTLGGEMQAWCDCVETCEGACDIDVSRAAFRSIAFFFGIYYFIAMILCVLVVKERKLDAAMQMGETPPLVPSLLATLRNKPFMTLLPAWICDMTAYTMIGTMLPFFVEYVVVPSSVPECSDGKRAAFGLDPSDNESEAWCRSDIWLGLGLVMLIGSQILAMPIWLRLTKCFGKFKTWLAFNLTTAVSNGLFVFIGRGDPKLCMILAILNGAPSGAQFLVDSIVADVIDYDEFLTGYRSEGRFTVFQTFIPKIVSVPAQAIPLALLAAFGFKEPVNGIPQEQSAPVRGFIMAVFFALPCLLALVSFCLKTRFQIRTKDITDAITKGAALHLKGEHARDPITGKYSRLFQFDESKDEKRQVWRLDYFFTSQLVKMQQLGPVQGARELAKAVKRTTMICIAVCLSSLLLCIISVASGLLVVSAWSWVPSFTVIAFGMSGAAVIFNRSRYKAALALMEKPIDADLLTRWVHHLKGTEEPPKHSLARAETEHFRSLRKNASHKSKRGHGWKGGTQADISEQVATEDDGGSQSGPRVSGTAPSEPADTLPNQLNGDSV